MRQILVRVKYETWMYNTEVTNIPEHVEWDKQ